jgi:hypothetical protein
MPTTVGGIRNNHSLVFSYHDLLGKQPPGPAIDCGISTDT